MQIPAPGTFLSTQSPVQRFEITIKHPQDALYMVSEHHLKGVFSDLFFGFDNLQQLLHKPSVVYRFFVSQELRYVILLLLSRGVTLLEQ